MNRGAYRIRLDDPLSAAADIHWTLELGRGDWQVRTETETHLECDADHYHLSARVRAYEGEREVFERSYRRAISRLS